VCTKPAYHCTCCRSLQYKKTPKLTYSVSLQCAVPACDMLAAQGCTPCCAMPQKVILVCCMRQKQRPSSKLGAAQGKCGKVSARLAPPAQLPSQHTAHCTQHTTAATHTCTRYVRMTCCPSLIKQNQCLALCWSDARQTHKAPCWAVGHTRLSLLPQRAPANKANCMHTPYNSN
jgi:hypothetical protein